MHIQRRKGLSLTYASNRDQGYQVSKRRILTQEEILRLMKKSDPRLSDLSDDDNAANKAYKSRILEGESGSDESNEEKHGNILNGKTILDHSLP
ncbi:hypothetical protein TNCV_4539951 [Trichonephila clavipes]|nr:hypothetical protein TNCV_4539951 [Trichonephila clavipes]